MAFDFKFEQPERSETISIRLSGRLTLGPQLLQFGRRVAELLASLQPTGLILKMDEIGDIDSAGLGELVVIYTTAGHGGCRFCLLSPSPRIVRLLETTKLSGILPHFDDNEVARAWIKEQAGKS